MKNPKLTTYNKLNEKYINHFLWTYDEKLQGAWQIKLENAYLFCLKDNNNMKNDEHKDQILLEL